MRIRVSAEAAAGVPGRRSRIVPADPKAGTRVLVSAALSCLDVAATCWTEVEGGQTPTELVDGAFAAIRH
jgi:hypothetical protein